MAMAGAGARVRVRVRVSVRVRVRVRVRADLRDVRVPQPVACAATRGILKLRHPLQPHATRRGL